ncbi:MAG: tRNA-dihydrouridine synthase [bacterium]|nr:tRNA-dihydrouridine synthase [bacterium]
MNRPAGFWKDLPKPIFTLAPMIDVTDAAFRRVIAGLGKPDVFFTEFVSCRGLFSPGRPKLMKLLRYDENQRPIVAQVFGKEPEYFLKTAEMVQDLKFDGIDINMGCPDKNICKQSSGAALIKDPELAKEIIHATIEGAGNLPVSVKTRIGFNKRITEEWLGHLLQTEPVAVTVHLRTAKEMSKVEAHWEEMEIAAPMFKGSNTLLMGNGDLRDLDHAQEMVNKYEIDGAMLGRAIFGNPWLFDRTRKSAEIPLAERLDVMQMHADSFLEIFGDEKNFLIMRKHLREHAAGFNGAKELRVALETISNPEDVRQALDYFRLKYLKQSV